MKVMVALVVLFVIVGDFIDAIPAIIIFMPIKDCKAARCSAASKGVSSWRTEAARCRPAIHEQQQQRVTC